MHSDNWSPAALNEDWQYGGFGLYLHWPFCQSKCPYCDFNSHVSAQIDQQKWLAAYLQELSRYGEMTKGRVVSSVFFGGGTPSLMDPDVVASIIDAIRRIWPMANDPEITLEANPGSVEAGRFRAYGQAGVNRVSMGIQALNNPDLRKLGRLHSVEEALKAYEIAKNCFDRTSFDLIYARQNQTLSEWKSELRQALDLAVDHLSLYQLTIEQGTAFGDRYALGKLNGLPQDELSADMYSATQEICEDAGYFGYEISNHARPGQESRHNSLYWQYGDYVGIGPGAHGRLTLDGQRFATEALRYPQRWLDGVANAQPEHPTEEISAKDQAVEMLMMGLRLAEGIDRGRFERLNGQPLPSDSIDRLGELGMIGQSKTHIWATKAGRPVLNAILRELLV